MALNVRMCWDCEIREACEKRDAFRRSLGFDAVCPTSELCHRARKKGGIAVPWTFPKTTRTTLPAAAEKSSTPAPAKREAAQLTLW